MKIYIYEGITPDGEKIKGKFFGTYQELLRDIKTKNILVTDIKEEKRSLRKGKFSIDDFYQNIEELVYLLSSGLQIDRAVNLIVRNSRKESVIEFWNLVLSKLKEGKTLSMALKEAGEEKKFKIPEFYINIISVGEEVGNTVKSLQTVLEDLEFKQKLKSEVKSALAYPSFLLIVSILTVFFVSGFILPKFSEIFTEKEIERLPEISKITLSFGKFLNQNFEVFFFGFVATITAIVFMLSSYEIRNRLKTVFYKLPYLKRITQKIELSYVLSSLGTMLSGGVEISRAIRLSSRITAHSQLKKILEETYEEIKKGHRISQIWRRYEIIPEDVISLTIVGENSAKLGEIFEKLGKKYMESFKTDISRLLVFLEPAIIVFLGLFIAFIVVSIMLAVVSVSDIYG